MALSISTYLYIFVNVSIYLIVFAVSQPCIHKVHLSIFIIY